MPSVATVKMRRRERLQREDETSERADAKSAGSVSSCSSISVIAEKNRARARGSLRVYKGYMYRVTFYLCKVRQCTTYCTSAGDLEGWVVVGKSEEPRILGTSILVFLHGVCGVFIEELFTPNTRMSSSLANSVLLFIGHRR